MGVVSSRLKFQKKPTIRDVLKDLDKEIKSTQEYRKSIEIQRKHLISTLFLYSLVLYIVAGCIIYSHDLPRSFVGWVLCCGPLVGFLFVIWFLKLLLTWYFRRETQSNKETLEKLKERKYAILDHVRKTKTFNEAEDILAEFNPGYIKKLGPVLYYSDKYSSNDQQKSSGLISSIFNYVWGMRFLSRNNYALICQKCSAHNGLVSKDQYENAAFQCCYCLYQNDQNKEAASDSTSKYKTLT